MALWTSETGAKSSRNGVLDIGLDRAPKQEVAEVVKEVWMCESGKDECVHTSEGTETVY